MQQRIGFCSTADGARIAYATVGSGPALIYSQWASHLELEWEEPRIRDFWETVGQHHMVVRYDRRGCGLSDQNRTDFSLESEVRPIEAIVKELGLKSLVLWGQGGQGAAATIAYALKSPDRVSHLIFSNSQARWHGSLSSGESQDSFRALVLSDWRMASLAMAERVLGDSFDASSVRWYLRIRQESVTYEMLAQLLTFWWSTEQGAFTDELEVTPGQQRIARHVVLRNEEEIRCGVGVGFCSSAGISPHSPPHIILLLSGLSKNSEAV